MCGIAGGITWQGHFPSDKLEKSVATLYHRGPDESDIFSMDRLGLAHSRLSIIDLEGGKQPLQNAEKTLHLVANGEVYNYIEIRDQIDSSILGNTLSRSDSEAILQVYQQYGLEGFNRLNGMYAFALYDSQVDELILCRDRLGIKPLFYAETPQGVFFASEIKALLPLLYHSPEINDESLIHFFQYQFNTGRKTIFQGISRVLPGEYLVVANGNIRHKKYWDATEVAPQKIGYEDAVTAFEPLFDQVMTEHMRADVPFGLFLSGGIDSSLLLAELAKRKGQGLKTYSIGYSGTTLKDEVQDAEILAKHFGADHQSIRVGRDDLFQRIVYSIWAADDLMRDYASLPTSLLSEVAGKELKVVFSGEGGDESFAGYRRYAPNLENKLKSMIFGAGGVKTRGQWSRTAQAQVFPERIKQINIRAHYTELWKSLPKSWSRMQKAQYVDLVSALPDNLFVKADRMMMSFSLEGRVPFADHRIVEFGLSLPDELKYPAKRGKWFVRQWANKVLPREHLQKPKKGFYVPVREWMTGDFVHQLGQKLCLNPGIKAHLSVEGVKSVIHSHQNGQNLSREIWGLMQFAIWYRLFVERSARTPSPIENPLDWV